MNSRHWKRNNQEIVYENSNLLTIVEYPGRDGGWESNWIQKIEVCNNVGMQFYVYENKHSIKLYHPIPILE